MNEFLNHIVASTNMKCLTPPSALLGACGFLAANLYAKSVFGEDALVNLSVEKGGDGKLSGYIRIRCLLLHRQLPPRPSLPSLYWHPVDVPRLLLGRAPGGAESAMGGKQGSACIWLAIQVAGLGVWPALDACCCVA